MTTPTNRPSDGELEDRLRAAYERAVAQAGDDLAETGVVSAGLAAVRRRRRAGPLSVAAAVGAIAVAAILVASLVPPAPRTATVASQPPSPRPVGSLTPIQSSSREATPEPTGWAMPSGTIVPEVSPGWPFPSTVDGQPVYAVGGPAEERIAAATDDSPFLISGWSIPLGYGGSTGCGDFSMGSPTPDGVFFRDCTGVPLFSAPGGGATLAYYSAVRNGVFVGLADTVPMQDTQVRQMIIRVHVHDVGCLAADCARKPVLDEILLTGETRLDPAIVDASLPTKGISMQDAISIGLDAARNGYGVGYPRLVSVTLATAAVLGQTRAAGAPVSSWEWKIVASTPDGSSIATVCIDYVSGFVESVSTGSS